ncbi:hypothetical protein TW85_15925 [Marinomonas sp. S3726]|uniref:DsbA family protein n=1 Tax=Marinomonas sp. S3726 TaxID=579484 RepID=UPI0005FA6A12|nr:hypothetical protein [Marinomonas sp. S3726]KJZ12280.1 hypothetical protein TW85_15925 [Marinomonas sp. S3726]
MKDTQFIIIYDTYCGWCYGAAPLFDALVETGAQVKVLHRHLFQGMNAPRMKDGKGDFILKMDAHISSLTGQVFSQAYQDNVVLSDAEILDSTYSALAAALVHEQGPVKEFSLRQRLEEQRFINGVSAQNRGVVVQTLIEDGVEPDSAQLFDNAENIAKASEISQQAIELMARVSSGGVPTLVKITDGHIEKIDHSAFYGQPELIKTLVSANTKGSCISII